MKNATGLTKKWEIFWIGAILLLATFLGVFLLAKDGLNNLYYTSAVKSMAQNWRLFYFASYDPLGFITIDKPPFDFWIQAILADTFGFNIWVLILPQVLAHIFSIFLLYLIVKRASGAVAGLIAALVLAITPISIFISRSNQPDSMLVLFLLMAALLFFITLRTEKLSWLILSLLFIGIGFNIKMIQAYLVLPAFVLTYFLGSKLSWRKKSLNLILALSLMVIVSFAWIASVDLTPKNLRPFVGSTQNDSEFSLAMGFNGIQRLAVPFKPGIDTGQAGPLRFFNPQMGYKMSWFLIFGLLGLIVLVLESKVKLPLNSTQQQVLFWGVWLITGTLVVSMAQQSHDYYAATVIPALGALVGISFVKLYDYSKSGGKEKWLFAAVVFATLLGQTYLLYEQAIGYVFILFFLLVWLVLLLGLVLVQLSHLSRLISLKIIFGVILFLLCLPSLFWSLATILNINNPTPQKIAAGLIDGLKYPAELIAAPPIKVDHSLVYYLQSQKGQTKYLVGSLTSDIGSPISVVTGQPVLLFGGWAGLDKYLTAGQLKAKIIDNEVRFFLLSAIKSQNNIKFHKTATVTTSTPQLGGGNSEFLNWVVKTCPEVPAAVWQKPADQKTDPHPPFLYDCRIDQKSHSV